MAIAHKNVIPDERVLTDKQLLVLARSTEEKLIDISRNITRLYESVTGPYESGELEFIQEDIAFSEEQESWLTSQFDILINEVRSRGLTPYRPRRRSDDD